MRRLLMLSVMLASIPAMAQDVEGPYIGVGLGQMDFEDGFKNRLDFDDTMSSYSLRAGYRFSEKFAFEGVLGPSSSFNVHKSGTIPVFQADNGVYVGDEFDARLTGDIDYFEVRAIAHAGEHILLGLGYFSLDLSGTISGTTQLSLTEPLQLPGASFVSSLSDSDHGYSILMGAYFSVGDDWVIRAEYEYFDVSSPADLTVLGMGLQYQF